MNLTRVVFTIVFVLPAVFLSFSARGLTEGNEQTAIVARSGPTTILIWDAFQYMKENQSAENSGAKAERRIATAAFEVFAAKLPRLSKSKRVRLLVMVQKPANGDSLIYRNTTFSETTTILTMEAIRVDAMKNRAAWAKQLASGKFPARLHVQWESHL